MRLLSLICLARCAAALPDIGVTYAATGRLNVLMAAESVRRLSTRYAHIHTLSADDHATCERLRRDAPYEILSAVRRDRLLVYNLSPIWNYRSWRRHFANKPGCCSSASRVVEAVSGDLQPPPVYIDHACRKPREYAAGSGNASFFLGR